MKHKPGEDYLRYLHMGGEMTETPEDIAEIIEEELTKNPEAMKTMSDTPDELRKVLIECHGCKVSGEDCNHQHCQSWGECEVLHDKIMEWHEQENMNIHRQYAEAKKEAVELRKQVEKLREVAKIADLMRVHLPHLENYYQITKGMVLTEELKQKPDRAKEALKETEGV